MRREIGFLCRLLRKKIKQICPFFITFLALVYITKVEVYQSMIPVSRDNLQNGVIKGGNFIGQYDNKFFNTGTTISSLSNETVDLQIQGPENVSSQGENNAAFVKAMCSNYTKTQTDFTLTVRWSKDNHVMYCPVYKVGTTFWRRVFMIQREQNYRHLVNPFEISFEKDYKSAKVVWSEKSNISGYKVMFIRNPYVRLFSFYVDKLLAPNPVFWRTIGVKVVKFTRGQTQKKTCGHDVTFQEFIKYVIHTLETKKDVDPHWVLMSVNCRPCEIGYDFIGKMDSFGNDSLYVIKKLGLTKMANFMWKNGNEVANEDAIKDTLSQPFTFRIKYKPCMSFRDAVTRAWTKLQIRGLVGNETLRDVVLDEKKTRFDDLLRLSTVSRNTTKCAQRKQFKSKTYKEFWGSIEPTDIEKIRQLYKHDFEIFGYDDQLPI